MANKSSQLAAQLQAEVLALHEAATPEALAVTAAAAAATAAALLATVAPCGGPGASLHAHSSSGNQCCCLSGPHCFDGAKHFKGATEALTSQPSDFTNDLDLQVFLDLALEKSQKVQGWNAIFTIPVTAPPAWSGSSQCFQDSHHVVHH
jgi:hypothetical protein